MLVLKTHWRQKGVFSGLFSRDWESKMKHVVKYIVYLDIFLMGSIYIKIYMFERTANFRSKIFKRPPRCGTERIPFRAAMALSAMGVMNERHTSIHEPVACFKAEW